MGFWGSSMGQELIIVSKQIHPSHPMMQLCTIQWNMLSDKPLSWAQLRWNRSVYRFKELTGPHSSSFWTLTSIFWNIFPFDKSSRVICHLLGIIRWMPRGPPLIIMWSVYQCCALKMDVRMFIKNTQGLPLQSWLSDIHNSDLAWRRYVTWFRDAKVDICSMPLFLSGTGFWDWTTDHAPRSSLKQWWHRFLNELSVKECEGACSGYARYLCYKWHACLSYGNIRGMCV